MKYLAVFLIMLSQLSCSSYPVKRTYITWGPLYFYKISFGLNEEAKNFRLVMPNDQDIFGQCTGSFDFSASKTGTWSMSCVGGQRASGKFSIDPETKSYSFQGQDTDGIYVTFAY